MSTKIELSDGSAVEFSLTQRALWSVDDAMLAFRAALVDDAGIDPKVASTLSDAELFAGLTSTQQRAVATAQRTLTNAYILATAKRDGEALTEDDLADMEPRDYNTLFRVAAELLTQSRKETADFLAAPSPLSTDAGSSGSLPARTIQRTGRSRRK